MRSKIDTLKANGSYNKDSGSVKAAEFLDNLFFDPNDLIQVKYEMLRSVAAGRCSVKEASDRYGLSRQTYYTLKEAFEKQGLPALFRKKTGPKRAFKLNEEGQEFIDNYLAEHPGAGSSEINAALKAGLDISVHDRTVGRYISKKHLGGC